MAWAKLSTWQSLSSVSQSSVAFATVSQPWKTFPDLRTKQLVVPVGHSLIGRLGVPQMKQSSEQLSLSVRPVSLRSRTSFSAAEPTNAPL